MPIAVINHTRRTRKQTHLYYPRRSIQPLSHFIHSPTLTPHTLVNVTVWGIWGTYSIVYISILLYVTSSIPIYSTSHPPPIPSQTYSNLPYRTTDSPKYSPVHRFTLTPAPPINPERGPPVSLPPTRLDTTYAAMTYCQNISPHRLSSLLSVPNSLSLVTDRNLTFPAGRVLTRLTSRDSGGGGGRAVMQPLGYATPSWNERREGGWEMQCHHLYSLITSAHSSLMLFFSCKCVCVCVRVWQPCIISLIYIKTSLYIVTFCIKIHWLSAIPIRLYGFLPNL